MKPVHLSGTEQATLCQRAGAASLLVLLFSPWASHSLYRGSWLKPVFPGILLGTQLCWKEASQLFRVTENRKGRVGDSTVGVAPHPAQLFNHMAIILEDPLWTCLSNRFAGSNGDLTGSHHPAMHGQRRPLCRPLTALALPVTTERADSSCSPSALSLTAPYP